MVGELLILDDTNGLVKGGGTGEVADGQADEDHFGHRGSIIGFRPKDDPG